jgi:tripartite-type tricarboxylate transporter receptor subunit TctC
MRFIQHLIGALAAITILAGPLQAQAQGQTQQPWPNRPVKVLVAYPPGGAADLVTRLVANRLQTAFGQPFIVINRPGGNAIIAADAAAKSDPDGYTFYVSSPNIATLPTLFAGKLPFDPEKDFVPVGLMSRVPFFIFVHNDLKVNTLNELIALARSQPGKLSYGHNGTGTTAQLGMELLKQRTGIDLLSIPYKSNTAAQVDLAAGRVDIVMGDLTVGGGAAADGSGLNSHRVRALAATTADRSSFLPKVPSVAEAANLPGFDASIWFAMFAPTGTPADVITKVNAEMRAYLGSEEVRGRLAKIGQAAVSSTPEELRTIVRNEAERYGRVIQKAGIKID